MSKQDPPGREMSHELVYVGHNLQTYLTKLNHQHHPYLLRWEGFVDQPGLQGLQEELVYQILKTEAERPENAGKPLPWFLTADQLLSHVPLKWCSCWNNSRGSIDLLRKISIGVFLHLIGPEGVQFKFASFASIDSYRSNIRHHLPRQEELFRNLKLRSVDLLFSDLRLHPTPLHVLLELQNNCRQNHLTRVEKLEPRHLLLLEEGLMTRGIIKTSDSRIILWLNRLLKRFKPLNLEPDALTLQEFLRSSYLAHERNYAKQLWNDSLLYW